MTSTEPVIPGYEDITLLGRGGFATVYRARQVRFQREVAIKVVDRALADDRSRELFTRECLAIGQLSWHPHVVPVYDAAETEDGRPYLTMELLPGGSVDDALARGPIPLAATRMIGEQVADALAAAHEVGVLHRDLKPANILIDRRGAARLADFGIARMAGGETTAVTTLTGTLAYMAPELLQGERASVSTDVYGLGMTLITMALGGNPLTTDDPTPFGLVHRITNEAPPDLVSAGFPPALAELLAACTSRDVDRRPASAAEVQAALAAISIDTRPSDGETLVRPPGPGPTEPPPTHREAATTPVQPPPPRSGGPGAFPRPPAPTGPASPASGATAPPSPPPGAVPPPPPGATPPPGAPPPGPPQKPRRRAAVLVLGAVGLIALVVVVAAAVVVLGGGDDGPAEAAGDGLRIGSVVPDSDLIGPPLTEGLALAVSDINAAGGVLGQDVEVVATEDYGSSEEAVAGVEDLIDDGIDALIGPASTPVLLDTLPLVAEAEVPQCSGSITAPDLAGAPDTESFFRTIATDDAEATVLAELVVAAGAGRVAVVARDDDYGRLVSDRLTTELAAAGVDVPPVVTFPEEGADATAVAGAAADAGADAVVVIGFSEGAAIVSALLDAGVAPDQLFGSEGAFNPRYRPLVSPDQAGVIDGMTVVAPAGDTAFAERLGETTAGNVIYGAPTYDCAVVLALATEAAGTTDGEAVIAEVPGVTRGGEPCTTFARCRDLLADGQDIDYDGRSGPVEFADNGDPTQAVMGVYLYGADNKFTPVDFVAGDVPELPAM